jgi:hypothetical protein
MKKLFVCATLLAAAATLVSAGEILGKITADGASVGDGASVAAKCGDKQYPAVKTDKSGSYRIVIPETGKCTLSVTHKGQTATLSVASYDDAAQADIVLESKDGKLTARRK